MRSALIALALLVVPLSTPAAAGPLTSTEWSARKCSMEWDPVCARMRDGRLQTVTNSCQAKGHKARILYSGRCRGGR